MVSNTRCIFEKRSNQSKVACFFFTFSSEYLPKTRLINSNVFNTVPQKLRTCFPHDMSEANVIPKYFTLSYALLLKPFTVKLCCCCNCL
jgi:hypothetical protein